MGMRVSARERMQDERGFPEDLECPLRTVTIYFLTALTGRLADRGETSVVSLEVTQRLIRGGLLDHRHRRRQVVVLVLLSQQRLQSHVTAGTRKWVKEEFKFEGYTIDWYFSICHAKENP